MRLISVFYLFNGKITQRRMQLKTNSHCKIRKRQQLQEPVRRSLKAGAMICGEVKESHVYIRPPLENLEIP